MSTPNFFSKAADFAQRTIVIGLMSYFGFQAYQIFKFTTAGIIDSPYMKSTYFKDVEEKVKEDMLKDNEVNDIKQRDMYQEDDDSYLKEQVRPNILRPEFKKEYEQKK
jgi:hypothetical protein